MYRAEKQKGRATQKMPCSNLQWDIIEFLMNSKQCVHKLILYTLRKTNGEKLPGRWKILDIEDLKELKTLTNQNDKALLSKWVIQWRS